MPSFPPSVRDSPSRSSMASSQAPAKGIRRVVKALKRPFRAVRLGHSSKSAAVRASGPDNHDILHTNSLERPQSPAPVERHSLSSDYSHTMAGTVDDAKNVVHSDAESTATHEFPEPPPVDSIDASADSVGDAASTLYPTGQEVIDTSLLSVPSGARAPPPSMAVLSPLSNVPEPISSITVLEDVSELPSGSEVPFASHADAAVDAAEDTSGVVSYPALASAPVDVIPDPALPEPEVPDPFVVEDEPEEPQSTGEPAAVESSPAASSVNLEQSVAASSEIALAQSTILSPSSPAVPLPSPNLNKAVPPPPESDDEDDAPDLYVPGLLLPTMFLPIPNTDPLTTLLMKYVPPDRRPARDLSGEWQRSDFPTLVMTNSWRALARMARDRIVEADPENVQLILSLWYLRLSSLARLRLFNQTSAECTNLFTVLNAIEPASARAWVFARALPFELEVLHARLKYWAGDHMGHLDALAALLRRCRNQARAHPADAEMWRERGARMALVIASQLIEMKDFAAAAKLLEPLCVQAGGATSPAVRSAVGRVYLQSGYIAMAVKHFNIVAQDPTADPALKGMNAALLSAAEGDWPHAASELHRLLQADPEHFVAVNNLAVAYLNQGKLQEGIRILEEAIKASPSTALAAEPLLFNISTMYELRSSVGLDRKRDLLIEVSKWAGDGLRTTCLKMPTN